MHTIARLLTYLGQAAWTSWLSYSALVAVYITTLIPVEYTPAPETNDKLAHIAAFTSLLLLFRISHPGRSSGILCLGLTVFGCLIETTQYFIPYRFFSLADILANSLGLAIGLILIRGCNYVFPLQPAAKSDH